MARTSSDGPAATSRDRTLAAVLRKAFDEHAETAGLSARSLGKQIGYSHTTLWRWFAGKSIPSFEAVVAFVTALKIVGQEKDSILEIARNPSPNLVTPGPPGTPAGLAGVMELDRTAATMTEYSPLTVPGMLQTDDYARRVIRNLNPDMPEDKLTHQVTLRLGRQHAVNRRKPIRFTALIGEPAIDARTGGREVMVEQLQHLIDMSQRENVTIRIVPLGGDYHGGHIGPFVHYGFDDGKSAVVYLEHFRGCLFLDDEQDTADYWRLVDRLIEVSEEGDTATADERTREQLRKRISSWETT